MWATACEKYCQIHLKIGEVQTGESIGEIVRDSELYRIPLDEGVARARGAQELRTALSLGGGWGTAVPTTDL